MYKPLIGIDFDCKSVSLALMQEDKILWAVRILGNQKSLCDVLSELYYGKNYDLAIEDVQYQKNVQTYRRLIEFRRDIINCLQNNTNIIYDIKNQTWTTAILGVPGNSKRAQRKAASKRIASSYIGYEITDDNIADAICIAIYGAGLRKKAELADAKADN